MAYLVRSDGVRWGLPRLDSGDALVPGDPCTPAVVSKLLLLPCCLVDPRAEAQPGVALPAAVCLSEAKDPRVKESGAELRLSGEPAVVKELERRGSVEWPCSYKHFLFLQNQFNRRHQADARDPQTKSMSAAHRASMFTCLSVHTEPSQPRSSNMLKPRCSRSKICLSCKQLSGTSQA